MPSQLLHVLFGEDICTKIPAAHRKAFALGCQGPDIFYHSQGRRPVGLEYGTLLHRRGAGSFTAELFRLSKGNDALEAYALGFMTHAILDRHAHPYIVYKSEISRFAGLHSFFERIIDVLMLKLLRGEEITSWDQESLLAETCEDPPLGLKELLTETLIATFPERAGKDEKLRFRIENTLLDCANFYRLTAPSLPCTENRNEAFPLRKRHLVYMYPRELPGHIDFLNLKKNPWYSPADENKEDRRSFPEIYAGAVAAANGIAGCDDIANANAVGEAIGNSGLNIVDENGKPCAPCRVDPLPLEEVLERQAALHKL